MSMRESSYSSGFANPPTVKTIGLPPGSTLGQR